MARKALDNILADESLMDEIRTRVHGAAGLPRASAFAVTPEKLAAVTAEGVTSKRFAELPVSEAIIRVFGRPALLVQNDTYVLPQSETWRRRLDPFRAGLEAAIRAVGRLEVNGHPTFDWIGTAWMVSTDIAVTNRHVALEFAQGNGKTFELRKGFGVAKMSARVDFKEEYEFSKAAEYEIAEVLHIEPDQPGKADMALVRLRTNGLPLPPPVPLMSHAGAPDSKYVAVIGYPARDDRNNAAAMDRVFGDIYEKKRFAPGEITVYDDPAVMEHDCSTLGGNSGSAVIEVSTGQAVGLHFGGQYKLSNYAVKASVIQRELARFLTKKPVPGFDPHKQRPVRGTKRPKPPGAIAITLEKTSRKDYENLLGYEDDFLGPKYMVPLPTLTAAQKKDVAPVDGDRGAVLRYTHFSMQMSKSRRCAFWTAVNIDGNQLRRPAGKHKDWGFDPRVAEKYQTGPEVYEKNDLDRGHLVRRLDPVWGTEAEAIRANNNTFHFTNASPQVHYFNDSLWGDLEDYLLYNADDENLKINVFTGPIFLDDDKVYRKVKIPATFWKIAVMIRPDKKMSATAYFVSQKDQLKNIEFVFGQFNNYQVPIARVEKETGLKFGKLRDFDPLGRIEAVSAVRPLRSVEEIVF